MNNPIIIRFTQSAAIHTWMMKEYGSWEDHNKDSNHPCALLQQTKKLLTLTEQQAKDLVESGKSQATSWNDDEIEGGRRTKEVIMNYVNKIQSQLKTPSKPIMQSTPVNNNSDLLKKAAHIIVETQMGSISLLQRRMKLSFSHATHLMNDLEVMRIVGPSQGAKPREVLIKTEETLKKFFAK